MSSNETISKNGDHTQNDPNTSQRPPNKFDRASHSAESQRDHDALNVGTSPQSRTGGDGNHTGIAPAVSSNDEPSGRDNLKSFSEDVEHVPIANNTFNLEEGQSSSEQEYGSFRGRASPAAKDGSTSSDRAISPVPINNNINQNTDPVNSIVPKKRESSDELDDNVVDESEDVADSEPVEDPFADIRTSCNDGSDDEDTDEEVHGANDRDPSVPADILQGSVDEGLLYMSHEALCIEIMRKNALIKRIKREGRERDIENGRIIEELQERNAELEDRIRILENRLHKVPESQIPWNTSLERLLNGFAEVDDETEYREDDEAGDQVVRRLFVGWDAVYRDSCRQMNMSMNPFVVHPDLNWSQNRFEKRILIDVHERGMRAQARLLGTVPIPQDAAPQQDPFPFEKLPGLIQLRIMEFLSVKPGVIHCLSRLDKWNPPVSPDHFPLPCSGSTGLPHRFAYGKEQTSITRALKPNMVLRHLLVCKRWLYLGIHAFYGRNTFAFSSLGEFGRFFKGIGEARTQRVAHIELMWHGSIMPHHESHINQRTLPLMQLTRMRRLQTFTIFIEESAERRIRRKYEFPKVGREYNFESRYKNWEEPHKDYDGKPQPISNLNARDSLLYRTATQPNWRGNRSMRTTHGIDYVYQLRGMKWIRFYEVNCGRKLIRDWSFLDDINSVVTMPKQQRFAMESDLRNLDLPTGLLNYRPEDQDQTMIAGFYEPQISPSVCGGSDTSRSDGVPTISSTGSSTNTDDGSEGNNSGCYGASNIYPRLNGLRNSGHNDIGPINGDHDSDVAMTDQDEDGDPISRMVYPDEWSDSEDDSDRDVKGDVDSVPSHFLDDEVLEDNVKMEEHDDGSDSGVDMQDDSDPVFDNNAETINLTQEDDKDTGLVGTATSSDMEDGVDTTSVFVGSATSAEIKEEDASSVVPDGKRERSNSQHRQQPDLKRRRTETQEPSLELGSGGAKLDSLVS